MLTPSKAETHKQLEKILESHTLQGSEGLKAFLRFVVEKVLEDDRVQLKEYTIAHEVLGRDVNYDPRIDSIVRVQAGRLRSKLHEYYESEGKSDRIVIDLPKGHYTPTFSFAHANGGDGNAKSVRLVSEDTLVPAKARIFVNPWLKYSAGGFMVLSISLGVLALHYRSEASRLKGSLEHSSLITQDLQALAPLWKDFLLSPEPILIAYSNTIFEGNPVTGMKYWKPMYSPPAGPHSPPVPQISGTPEDGKTLIIDHYTGVGEVMGVYFVGNAFWKAGHSFRVKRSLLLTWDDLKTENIVFLGSPAENLLLRELPQRQEFVFQVLRDAKPTDNLAIVNLKPQNGEAEKYALRRQGPAPDQLLEDYAVVSLLKGLDPKHRLLILAGLTTLGTQAAAEYVTKPEYLSDLLSHLNTSGPSQPQSLPPYFQIVLKVKVNGGVPVQVSYVTHRVLR